MEIKDKNQLSGIYNTWIMLAGGSYGAGSMRTAKKVAGVAGRHKAETVPIAGCEGRVGFDPKVASNEMCTFLILNISSLQLIPVSIIAYRLQYGSASPTAIVGPAIVATLVSTLVGAVFAKVMDRGQ